MIRGLVVVLCMGLATGMLASCVAVAGTENSHRPTAGQELVDLKMALDRGAITQGEYEQKKGQILARN